MYKLSKKTFLIFFLSLPFSVGITILSGFLILEPLFSIPPFPFSIINVISLSIALTIFYEVRISKANKGLAIGQNVDFVRKFLRYPLILILLCIGINVFLGVLLSAYILDNINSYNVIFDGIKGLIIGIIVVLLMNK